MTTRQEFALRFAVASYSVVVAKFERMDAESAGKIEWNSVQDTLTSDAVKMADLLLAELAKDKSPS